MLTVDVVTSSQVFLLALPAVGTPYQLVHRSDHVGITPPWSDLGGWTLEVLHAFDAERGRVCWGDGRPATTAGVSRLDDGTATVVDPAGRRYRFDAHGRHLTTDDPATGLVICSVQYGADGAAASVVDGGGSGPVVTIERAADGSIVLLAADARRTTLTRSPAGWLTGVTDPTGATYQLVADHNGRVCTIISPEGRTTSATYDEDGRLVREDRPGGGGSTLWRARVEDGTKVLRTTDAGVELSSLTTTLPDGGGRLVMGCCGGTKTTTTVAPDGSRTVEYPDGSTEHSTDAIGDTISRSTPGGLETRRSRETSFVPGAEGSGWVSESTVTVDASSARVTTDISQRNRTVVSPGGRWRRFTYDEVGRVTRVERSGLDPVDLPPGTQGRPPWEELDAVDRLTCARYPDGTGESFGYDTDGRMTTLTRPDGARHAFDRDLDGNLVAWHAPTGGTLQAQRDVDGRLTSMRTSAGRSLTFHHGVSGSLQQVVGDDGADGTTTIERDHAGRLVILRHADPVLGEQAISYGWDGSLPTGVRWSGLLEATAVYRYGPGWRLEGITVDRDPEDVIAYDADGLVVTDGPFRLERDAATGAVRRLTDGQLTVEIVHDSRGRLVSREHNVGDIVIYRLEVASNDHGLVTRTSEHSGGVVVVRQFEYDSNGQLVQVRDGEGRTLERHAYDVNGNPTERESGGRRHTLGYNAGDHVVSIDGSALAVDADGISGPKEDAHARYGSWSELRESAGARYAYDGFGTRVARQDGEGFRRYLQADPRDASRLSLVLDPAGSRSRYRYAADNLVAVDRNGQRFYVACDLVGTPKVVSNATGQVVKTIERGSFGDLVSDSDPSWVVDVGFAGGIDDAPTGRVRFGLRDYDPMLGRWTTADPLGFLSRDRNLWRYCGNNPVSRRDPTGTDSTGGGPVATTGSGGGLVIDFGLGSGTSGVDWTQGSQAWQDYGADPGQGPGSIFDVGAGDTTPAAGTKYIWKGFSSGGFGFDFRGRRCRVTPSSGNIFPYRATPPYPGIVEYTDFGSVSGSSGGGTFECQERRNR